MMKIDWKMKLSSRKFWLAIVGVIGAIGAFLKMDSGTIEQITTLVMSFATLIAYILAEGYIDGKREEGDVYVEEVKE
jgi:phage shock protein PspC (stress-responsive transcriptional regulator)